MWQQLIETALLGTDKKPLSPEVFPDEISAIISGNHHDLETTFLNVLSASYFYLEAGALPLQLVSQPDTTVIEETQPFTDASMASVYDLIDKLPAKLKEALLSQWLDVIISKNEILPVELAIKLVIEGNGLTNGTKSKITKVIGRRVNKTLELHTGLKYHEVHQESANWIDGNLSERKALLSVRLSSNQNEAIELLKATWAQEPIVNKKAFLDIIRTTEIKQDNTINYLQTLYDTEFAFQPKEKKTEKECRRILAEILLRSSNSPLHISTMSQLSGYLTAQKKKSFIGLLMSKQQRNFQLPVADDSYWNSDTMGRLWGFETKNYDIDKYQSLTQSWLAELLEFIPINKWVDQQFESHTELLNCFIDSPQFHIKRDGKETPVFIESLYRNALDYGDQQLVLALLPRITAEKALPLLRLISASDYEEYIKNNALFADEKALDAGPYNETESWSASFSEYVIKSILHKSTTNQYVNFSGLGMVLARYIPPKLRPQLEQLNVQAATLPVYYQWQTNIYQNVRTAIDIKEKIQTNNHNR